MTKQPTPMELMAAGYKAAQPQQDAARKEKLACEFRPNERMEKLIDLRTRDRAAYDRIVDPTTMMALGQYQLGRDAAGYGGDDDGDTAA
jgi:hypothetical protein